MRQCRRLAPGCAWSDRTLLNTTNPLWENVLMERWFFRDKKRASKLFDGEEVEPSRLKMRMKQAVSLVGVQCTHHLRSGLHKQATA